jgi:hypothetical protein
MNIYIKDCPDCQTPGEWCEGEQLEDCCDGATLRRVRKIVMAKAWPPPRSMWRQLREILR